MVKKPIIIIGSGISGLTIAAGITDSDFLILEARDRIGGRIFTNSQNMDMGAAWLHGSHENPLNKFLDYNNLIPVSSSNPWMHSEKIAIKYLSDKYVIDEETRQSTVLKWRKLASLVSAIPNKTVGQALREIDALDYDCDNTLLFSFIYMMEVWCGGSVNNIQTSFLKCDEFQNSLFGDYAGSHYLFKNGAKQLVDMIINTAHHNIYDRIKYNKVVVDVVYGETGVSVYTQDGSIYYCDKLCITVPPGPLQQIRFTPPLDQAKTKALSQIKMGSYKKIQMEFHRADVFWNDAPMILTFNPNVSGKEYYLDDKQTEVPYILWNNYMYSKNKPILEAVCPADIGWRLSGLSDEEIIDMAMLNLRTYYPTAADPKA
jgi:monoamine oxidase